MGESFVDVSYRGLDLGRRLRLRDVRPDVAYVEIPLPMPVGTTIDILTDEGHRFAAKVTAIHEQVGGSDQQPGMRVAPVALGAAEGWWKGLVDPSIDAPPAPPPAPEDARTTQVMSTDAVEAALAAGGVTGPVYIDDGRKTTVMDSVDISRITGEAVGLAPAENDDAEITIEPEDSGEIELSSESSGEIPVSSTDNKVNGKRSKGTRRAKRKKK